MDKMNIDAIPIIYKWINKGQGSISGKFGLLKDHWPDSCVACADYRYWCSDSMATFIVGGSETSCMNEYNWFDQTGSRWYSVQKGEQPYFLPWYLWLGTVLSWVLTSSTTIQVLFQTAGIYYYASKKDYGMVTWKQAPREKIQEYCLIFFV